MTRLSTEYRDYLDIVERFARERVAPRAAEIDREDQWFPDLLGEAAEIGLQGVMLDDGHRFDPSRVQLAMMTSEILASYSPSLALTVGAARLHTLMLTRYATSEVCERWLSAVVSADAFGSMGISESEAGTDIRNGRTVARRTADGWILTGGKAWTTLSPVSDFTVVLAKIESRDRDAPMGMFLVERGMDGLSYGENDSLISYRGVPMANVYFDDLVIPAANVMDSESGFEGVMKGLNYARLEAAALGSGIIRGCLRQVTEYANERIAFEVPIARHQAVQLHVGRMVARLEASRGLLDRAAWTFGVDDPEPDLCAAAKFFASDAAMDSATAAVSLFGGYGVSHQFEIERYFRDAKATQIFDGTSDILTIRVGRSALSRKDW